jgi:hypothetical protein
VLNHNRIGISMRMRSVTVALAAATLAGCASAPAAAPSAATTAALPFGNPYKLAPTPTSAGITESDLRTRLYIFADDSMQGRQYGRAGNMKGTEYIARELQRLGVEPAGDNGTYFQEMPVVQRKFAATSTFAVKGRALKWNDEWVPVPSPRPREINGVAMIYGGRTLDTVNFATPAQVAGKVVLIGPAAGAGPGGNPPGLTIQALQAFQRRLLGAAGVVQVSLDGVSAGARAAINDDPAGVLNAPPSALNPMPAGALTAAASQAPPASIRVTRAAAEALIGGPLDAAKPGTEIGTVAAKLDFVETPVGKYARNVVGIVRGSDSVLKKTYVAIGGHPDHVGYNRNPVDHDSLLLWNAARQALMNKGGELHQATPAELASIKINLDSVRKLRPARLDSISNGADDDGSGSMALLEIAEAASAMKVKPKRSLLFVWNNGEEVGLYGSAWYTMHPTVPRDSIVAQINIDMIGRGRVADLPGGGDDYLAVVGSRKLSSDLGKAVVTANLRQPAPFRLDYRFDTTTVWPGYNNIYGRSDHANYARFNIPIAFFFTALHADYHQVTDEPQYIDYPHYTRITQYINDLVLDIANRAERPALDRKP